MHTFRKVSLICSYVHSAAAIYNSAICLRESIPNYFSLPETEIKKLVVST